MGIILAGKPLQEYFENRIEGKNLKSEDIQGINLYNGTRTPTLLAHFAKKKIILNPIIQENGREPLFHNNGTIYVPQYSGIGRGERYERLITRYKEEHRPDIVFHKHETLDAHLREEYLPEVATEVSYDNNAYDHVKKLSQNGILENITHIIFGSTKGVARQAKVIQDLSDDYLDTQILDVEGTNVLNFGYVYADQAGKLLFQTLRAIGGHLRRNGAKPTVNVYMFGRFGGLADTLERQDIVFPTHIINQTDIDEQRPLIYECQNIFAAGDWLNLNVRTAVDETTEQLEAARVLKAKSIDMESFEMVMALETARQRYNPVMNLRFGLIGHISDNPLKDDTLATELESDKGERAAVAKIFEHIAHS